MLSYRILGPVEVHFGDTVVYVGGPREQKALVVLLLDANRSTTVSRLADVLWENTPPRSADAQIRNVIAILRRRIGAATGTPPPIRRSGTGFTIEIAWGQLDLEMFRVQARTGADLADSGQYERAAEALRAGLALWRGPRLGDFDTAALDIESYQFEEQRLTVVERLLELDLTLGRHRDIIGELATLVARYPLRERFVELHMLALYRSGRRQDALNSFASAQMRLTEQAGLDPRPELVQIHNAVLQDHPELDLVPAGPAARWSAGRWQRI